MPLIVSHNSLSVNATNVFRDAIQNEEEYLYAFLSKSDEWSDENDPPEITDNISEEIETRDGIHTMKRIGLDDTAYACRRIDWNSGTVYAQYSPNDGDLFSKDFYVMTPSYKVYKCINNNSGSASTEEPISTTTSVFTTADGYQWKYMFTLSSDMINRFLTNDWIPIPTLTQRNSLQIATESSTSYSVGGPLGGHSSNPVEELGGNNLIVTCVFDSNEGGQITTMYSFRKLGLIVNPRDNDGDLFTDTVVFSDPDDSTDSINRLSGRVLFSENRVVVTRELGQTERLNITINF